MVPYCDPFSTLSWSEGADKAFLAAKGAMSDACILYHPLLYAPLALHTDASDVGIKAVLEQLMEGEQCLLGFISHMLTSAKRQYSIFDQKLLAVYAAT